MRLAQRSSPSVTGARRTRTVTRIEGRTICTGSTAVQPDGKECLMMELLLTHEDAPSHP